MRELVHVAVGLCVLFMAAGCGPSCPDGQEPTEAGGCKGDDDTGDDDTGDDDTGDDDTGDDDTVDDDTGDDDSADDDDSAR